MDMMSNSTIVSLPSLLRVVDPELMSTVRTVAVIVDACVIVKPVIVSVRGWIEWFFSRGSWA